MNNAYSYAADLRCLAEWLDENAELLGDQVHGNIGTLLIHAENKEEMALFVKALGSAQKKPDGSYFNVVRKFGPVSLEVWTNS